MSIKITTVPPAAASATSTEFLVECEEALCHSVSVSGSVQPVSSITLSVGTITEMNGVAIIPVVATIVATTPNGTCGCCSSQVFVESVNVPLTSTTNNTVTLEQGTTSKTELTNIKCCKARGIKMTTTAALTIA